jgi:hypothetical protein
MAWIRGLNVQWPGGWLKFESTATAGLVLAEMDPIPEIVLDSFRAFIEVAALEADLKTALLDAVAYATPMYPQPPLMVARQLQAYHERTDGDVRQVQKCYAA